MKATLFFIAVFLGTLSLSAQEFVLEKESYPFFSKDSLVYREKGVHELMEKYGETMPTSGQCLLIPTRTDGDKGAALLSKYQTWLEWVYLHVVPKEIYPYLDSASTLPLYNWKPREEQVKYNRYKGMMLTLYYDWNGKFITACFYVDKDIRDKITPRHLKEIYQKLKQIRVPKEFITEIVRKKEVVKFSFNKNYFLENLNKNQEDREYVTNLPEWEALSAEFERTSIKK